MNFASKYVLDADEDEYESISDDEFKQGMNLSESDSGSDDESREEPQQQRGGRLPMKKAKIQHHWRRLSPLRTDGAERSYVPAAIGRAGNSKLRFRRADTNVVSVDFGTLMQPGNMHAGDPIVCSKCSAVLSHISKLQTDNKMWKCEFCGESTEVDIEADEVPSAEDVTFLLEPAMSTASSTISGMDESLVIFCVDVSGSMCVTTEILGKTKLRGTNQLRRLESFNETRESQFLPSQRNREVTYISRLQAMQAAVDYQLGEMAKDHPSRRVALITFNNEVTIVGDGTQQEIVVAGDKLTKEEELCKAGSECALPQAIKNSRKVLGEKVYNLEEGGATALGPALLVAVNLAAHHPGSKVILCTDGKANIGLGQLEDLTENEEGSSTGSEFYTKTAESALAKGVTVSVLTIQGTDCKLVHLGMMADKTGGQVNIVDPLKLTEEFTNILADPIIATKVKATLLVHKEMFVVDVNDSEKQLSRAEHYIGNVKRTSNITFEFAKRKQSKDKPAPIAEQEEENSPEMSKDKEPVALMETEENPQPKVEEKKVEGAGAAAAASTTSKASVSTPEITDFPFQLQIEYFDTEGNKALRVITRLMPATRDRRITESHANLDILGTHVAKKSSDLALQGQFSSSRGVALMNQRLAWRNCHSTTSEPSDRIKYKNIYSKIKSMENRIQMQQMREIDMYGRTRSDSESDDEEDQPACDSGARQLQTEGISSDLCVLPPSRAARRTPLGKTKKAKKRFSQRSSEMEDNMANMMYQFRNVDTRSISEPAGHRVSASGSSSSRKTNESQQKQTPVTEEEERELSDSD